MDSYALSQFVWRSKYCLRENNTVVERDIGETLRRVATAVAAAEEESNLWSHRFLSVLGDFEFLPAGRILANAGSAREATLLNCFVAGTLDDSLRSIMQVLGDSAVTMQQGGGIGLDFSTLRPAATQNERTGSVASGPVSFMHLWDTLCTTLLSTSARRGAMMGVLSCRHPDIEAFIHAKRRSGHLRNFNLSVAVDDDFMRAVGADDEWTLRFPCRNAQSGDAEGCGRAVPARALWHTIAEAAHGSAEPGVLFVDTINRENNLAYCESISATNPCGEVPLPPHGACNLGSINVARLVREAFTAERRFDFDRLRELVSVSVRFLDDVLDVSRFPLPAQADVVRDCRRIGLGITGFADALAMLGLAYSSDAARQLARGIIEAIRDTAYATSIDLAQEKGAFPLFERDRYMASPFVERLPGDLRDRIAAHGIRNSHLLSVAPAGTISLLAGNVSSGIEPIFSRTGTRSVRDRRGRLQQMEYTDFAYAAWQRLGAGRVVPETVFEAAQSIAPDAHLAMQATLQPYVDNAISKTINLPETATPADIAGIFGQAHRLGLKGCTVFRPGASVGQVLQAESDKHCCHVDREAD
jgi:ribonucleoside-diphosphate reductase alpha chain